MKTRLVRSVLTALPVIGMSIAAGTATTTMASAAPAARHTGPSASKPHRPAGLNSISCVSARFCMGIGSDYTTAEVAAEWWDGRHWHRLPIPSLGDAPYGYLRAVSCPSATECVAVGSGISKSGSSRIPVAETWTRSGGWKISMPVVPAGLYSELDGISCPFAGVCYAAGGANQLASVGADQLPLVERWTPGGGWVRVALPTLPGSADNDLSAISCMSATQCAAVGSYSASPTTAYGLIEQLNGPAWSVTRAPRSANAGLFGISCPSASLCVAVGSLSGGPNLAERWSGGTWTAATPPGPPISKGSPWLNDVSCASTTRCVAVGGTLSDAVVDTLNGTTWTMTARGGPGFNVGLLYGVSCFSTSTNAVSCAAVGSRPWDGGTGMPLSAFLAGSKWSIVPTV